MDYKHNFGHGFGIPRPLPERRDSLLKQVMMGIGLVVGIPAFLFLMWVANAILVIGYGD